MTPRRSLPILPRLALQTDADLPAAPQQARSREKRKKLLQAGRVLFGQKGYEATSIEKIAAHAGTATGAFYQHFHSKRQLLIVLMNELLERLGGLVLRPQLTADVRLSLRSFLAAVFRVDLAYYGVVRAWQEAALTDVEFSRIQKKIESWTQARILAVFQLLQRLPHARRNQDLATFSRMMDRHFWSLLARGSSLRRQDFEREIAVAADVIYHYLFLEAEPRGKC